MKTKLILGLLVISLLLISGCRNIQVTDAKDVKVNVGEVYNINNEKYDLKNSGYLKGIGDYYSIDYSKGEQRILAIAYYVNTNVFLQCSEFDMGIFALDTDFEDLVSNLKTKITCDDVYKQELIIHLENFEHISQNLVDYLINKFTIYYIVGNTKTYIEGVPKCSEVGIKENRNTFVLSECVGDFDETKNIMVVRASEHNYYKEGILGKVEWGSFYIKKCSETNFIKILTTDKEGDMEELIKDVVERLNC